MKNPPKLLIWRSLVGKHSIEKEKKKINLKKELIAIFIITILIIGINFLLSHRGVIENNNAFESETSKTIEGEKLVIKSNSEYNKVIEYTFENNVVRQVVIYEQFEEEEKFEKTKATYDLIDEIEVISVNNEQLSLKIEKKDFGSDTGMSYEQIYDKYLVQIIGAYEIIT